MKRKKTLQAEIAEFILWLTPCGQVYPGPSLKLIGKEARKLAKKLYIKRGDS